MVPQELLSNKASTENESLLFFKIGDRIETFEAQHAEPGNEQSYHKMGMLCDRL